jgi:hypothetical protein
MRIILWLAAGVAVAIGTAAPARPGGMGSGHGSSPPGVWSSGGGHGSGNRVQTRFGIGTIEIDRGHGRRHGRSGRSGRDDFELYGAAGIVGPVGAVDPQGNGFFSGGGGEIGVRGGRPYFEYDRAYPYEWTSAADRREQWVAREERMSEPPPRCTVESGVRVCRGWR